MAPSKTFIAIALLLLFAVAATQALQPHDADSEAGQAGRMLSSSYKHKGHNYQGHYKKQYHFVHQPYYKYRTYHNVYYYYVDYCYKQDYVCFDHHDKECGCDGYYKYKLYRC